MVRLSNSMRAQQCVILVELIERSFPKRGFASYAKSYQASPLWSVWALQRILTDLRHYVPLNVFGHQTKRPETWYTAWICSSTFAGVRVVRNSTHGCGIQPDNTIAFVVLKDRRATCCYASLMPGTVLTSCCTCM